jgi:hypothetical protein
MMEHGVMDMQIDPVDEVLKQFDRSSPDKLLRSIAAEIARLRAAVARCDERLAALETNAPPPELPRFVMVDAEQTPDRGQGFYQLERNGEGVPMRWTGPNPDFSFEIAIDRGTVHPFALHFLKFYAPTDPPELRVQADGGEVEVTVEAKAKGGFVARGALPARPGAGLTTLRFACPKVGSPRDEGFDDDRVLGLLFFRLEVGEPEEGAETEASALVQAFG